MRTLPLFSILALITAPLPGVSGAGPEHPYLQRFNVEHGLSQSSITALLQDHRGFLWIGTFDGLNRFDGTTFTTYRHDPHDAHTINSSWIVGLVEDSARTLWVITDRGLNRFDRTAERFRHEPPETAGVVLWPLSGPLRTLYAARTDTLLRRDPASGTWTPLVLPPTSAGSAPHLVAEDGADHVWTVAGATIFRINIRTRTVERMIPAGTRAIITILPDPQQPGVLWVGCSDSLLLLHDETLSPVTRGYIGALLAGAGGPLWAGTQEGLLRVKMRAGQPAVTARIRRGPEDAAHLSHDVVTALAEDAAGGVWIGTYNGVNLLHRTPPPFAVYRHIPGDPGSLGDNFVLPIAEDREGNVWFGTFGSGVSVLERGEGGAEIFRHIRHQTGDPNGLRSDNIRSLLLRRDGTLLIGTSNGLQAREPDFRTLRTVLAGPAEVGGRLWVESMAETPDGSVWIPHEQTLLRLSGGGSLARIRERVPMPDSREILFMTADAAGMVWIGRLQGGLLRFEPATGRWTSYVHDPKDSTSISDNNVWSILPDPGGGLWVGTGRGLNRLNLSTGVFTRHLEQEGFPSSWVYGILPDDAGRLWLSTNAGLVLFDPGSLHTRFRSFTRADGIAGDDFNRRSFCRLGNGDLLFGGPNGVTRVRPASLRSAEPPAPFLLTGIFRRGARMVFDRDVAEVTKVEFTHDENVFAFSFASLDFTAAERTRYAYRLEGVDQDWITTGARQTATYAYVPPGEYLFRARASRRAGTWDPNEIAVHVRVHPPFWAAWWFIALSAAAFSGGLFWLVRARVRRLLEIERLRSRIARDLHDNIGSSLSSIAMTSELLQQRTVFGDKERGMLERISSVALATVADMRDIVWLIRPGNDSLEDLLLRMKDTAGALLEGSSLALAFPEGVQVRRVPLEWKQNVYLLYKEALANIARHAHAARVDITVEVHGDRLRLRLQDDGAGFDPDAQTGGNGLRNMRDRAAFLGGRLDISSRPGGGTRVTFDARIP